MQPDASILLFGRGPKLLFPVTRRFGGTSAYGIYKSTGYYMFSLADLCLLKPTKYLVELLLESRRSHTWLLHAILKLSYKLNHDEIVVIPYQFVSKNHVVSGVLKAYADAIVA